MKILSGNTKNPRLKGITFFFLTSLFWSSSGVLIKLIIWNPIAIAGIRSGIASIFMLPFLEYKKFKINFLNILTALSFSLTVIFFVSATKLTTAANAIILQYTAPFYTAIFSGIILKERIKASDILFTLITITGIFLFFIDKYSTNQFTGNIIALFSGITFGWFYLLMRKQKDSSPINSAFLGNVTTLLFSIPFITIGTLNNKDILLLLVLGVFQMGVPMVFYSIGIKYITALDAILISTLEPILNPVWVFIVIGEKPGKWAFIGGFIVISSIIISQLLKGVKS